MVTLSNTGVLYNPKTLTTYLVFLANGALTVQSQNNLVPGAYLVNNNNPIGAPFMIFVRLDPVTNTAYLQVSPEPLFPQGVLWTVPTGLPFSDNFWFSTETGPRTSGLLPGFVYYQTPTNLVAVNMHNGSTIWNITLPAPSAYKSAPIIATKAGTSPRYFLYAMTTGADNNHALITNLACCSGNGICSNTTKTCACFPNYFGANCATFCDVNVCQGFGPTGQQRGICGINGCKCNAPYYGTNCLTQCNTTTCNNRGSCDVTGKSCMCNNGNTFDFAVYSGQFCEAHMTNWFLIGLIVAAALVLLLVIILLVVACTGKSKTKKSKYDLINS